METLLSIVHYILCISLIILILLQAGKGADIGAAFGAGSSQTLFGPRGAATFLSKVTAAVAILFLTTSMTLSYLSREHSSGTVFQEVPAAPAPAAAPVEPAAEPAKETP